MIWLKNWFSNFEPFDEPLKYEDVLYTSVEHFFVAMKTTDRELRKKIAAIPHPGQAKKFGQKLDLRPEWNEIREDVMLYALRWKFRPNTSWGKILLATGNWEIVEWNNWHDNYWGVCLCGCRAEGHNRLGRLIMQVRSEIR